MRICYVSRITLTNEAKSGTRSDGSFVIIFSSRSSYQLIYKNSIMTSNSTSSALDDKDDAALMVAAGLPLAFLGQSPYSPTWCCGADGVIEPPRSGPATLPKAGFLTFARKHGDGFQSLAGVLVSYHGCPVTVQFADGGEIAGTLSHPEPALRSLTLLNATRADPRTGVGIPQNLVRIPGELIHAVRLPDDPNAGRQVAAFVRERKAAEVAASLPQRRRLLKKAKTPSA